MILLDANVLMYAAGADHPNKEPSVRFLERVARGEVEAALDAESLQEILHRYRALGRWAEGRRVYDLARRLFPEILPITAPLVDRARRLMDEHDRLSARDAVHAAVVFTHRLEAICSFDGDFDAVRGLRRIEP